jgi:hypothetical protein
MYPVAPAMATRFREKVGCMQAAQFRQLCASDAFQRTSVLINAESLVVKQEASRENATRLDTCQVYRPSGYATLVLNNRDEFLRAIN